jgi:hypothetical protein
MDSALAGRLTRDLASGLNHILDTEYPGGLPLSGQMNINLTEARIPAAEKLTQGRRVDNKASPVKPGLPAESDFLYNDVTYLKSHRQYSLVN